MYGKVFTQMYDGTIAASGFEVMSIWMHLICLADKNGEVDMTLEALATKLRCQQSTVEHALSVLAAPDPMSRSRAEEGRRIVLIDPDRSWGWRLVNYADYAKIRSEEGRKEYQKQWVRNKRVDKK